VVPPGVTVRDLGSRNGVTVDGVPVLHAPLRAGAQIGLGHTRLLFEVGDEVVDIELSARDRFELLVGRSPAMRAVFALLERAAPSEATVLLEGETGTGKDSAAESIHQASPRRDGPFVVVDCGAMPGTLLESELFGHERGAFTGADRARRGAFEAASGGTLFLDEIGELPVDLQPALLRALDQKAVRRVGSNELCPVDIRVLAATNRDLHAEVNARRFRSDLYYRLAVIRVTLPPLREREQDLPVLAAHLLAGMGAGELAELPLFRSEAFHEDLRRHSWPGNVRELRNYLETCVALRQLAPLPAVDAGPELRVAIDAGKPLRSARDEVVAAFERRYLRELLARSGGNVSAAARAAGVERPYFYRLLWRHGLR
jgi:DNA-binding NtrC family response regulator